jgi:hypothetical protein
VTQSLLNLAGGSSGNSLLGDVLLNNRTAGLHVLGGGQAEELLEVVAEMLAHLGIGQVRGVEANVEILLVHHQVELQ